MGYFEHLASSVFKENPNGDGWLYYPSGVLCKGRVVTDSNYKNKLFNFQKRMYMFLMPLGAIYGFYLANTEFDLYSLVPLLIIVAPIFLRQYWLIRQLPKSDIKLNYNEATTEAMKGVSSWTFYVLYASSTILVIIGLSSSWFFEKPFSEVFDLALMLIGFGVAGILLGLFAQKYKKSNKSLKRD